MTTKKQLDPLLAKRLLAYAAVASAAATLHPSTANAEVVYTPTHKNIDQDFYLDLNNDGIGDFHIHSYYLSGYGDLEVHPLFTGNKIVALAQPCGFADLGAAPLALGAGIGAGRQFHPNATCMANMDYFSSNGPWVGQKDHYLGFAFLINGQTHYGWARLSMDGFFCYPCIARIFGYAYETIPDKPIAAGDEGNGNSAQLEAAPLGALALGAPALNLWRKEENQ